MIQPLKNIRGMLVQIIDRGIILRHAAVTPSRPEGVEGIAAWLDVIEKEEKPAGFLVSAQRCEGSDEIEIYQLSIVREYRRQGLASLLVDYVIKQHELGAAFYARCYPKSNEAFSLLLAQGFKQVDTQPLGTRELYRYAA
ncbi:GNAT family N-acetyltransferase [Collimonas sp. NPDC087041]|uniref:GNAT family N-acetyltransferase n=1 Tax=Collimonas sp. NPDC087041 TaxID=3363960 RepID=UPI00382AC19A